MVGIWNFTHWHVWKVIGIVFFVRDCPMVLGDSQVHGMGMEWSEVAVVTGMTHPHDPSG